MKEEKTFIFFRSFADAIEKIQKDSVQLAMYRAVVNYGLSGTLPSFNEIDPTGALDAAFVPMQFAVDEAKACRERRSAAGKLGGAPKGNTNSSKNKQKQANSNKNNPNININKNKNNKKEITGVSKKTFSLPSLEKRQKSFAETIRPYVEQYGETMCNDFFAYWSEPNRKGDKMRFELEKTWEVSRRLATWKRRGEAKR